MMHDLSNKISLRSVSRFTFGDQVPIKSGGVVYGCSPLKVRCFYILTSVGFLQSQQCLRGRRPFCTNGVRNGLKPTTERSLNPPNNTHNNPLQKYLLSLSNMTYPKIEPLETLNPNGKEELSVKKIEQCFVVFDFSIDTLSNLKDKEIKWSTLNELVEYTNCKKSFLTDILCPEMVKMLAYNTFRTLPQASIPIGTEYDSKEDESTLEAAWPHLQLVYELFLRFLESPDFQSDITCPRRNELALVNQISHLNNKMSILTDGGRKSKKGLTMSKIEDLNYCILLHSEHGINPDGLSYKGDEATDAETFRSVYNEVPNGQYVPRVVTVDLEPTEIVEIISDQFISGYEDTAKNYARGHFTMSRKIIDQTINQIRKVTQACGFVQGYILVNSIGGGTGYGFSILLSERLSIEYTKISKFDVTVYPSLIMESSAVFENSLRFENTINSDLDQLRTNLIPFPRIYFPTSHHTQPYTTLVPQCDTVPKRMTTILQRFPNQHSANPFQLPNIKSTADAIPTGSYVIPILQILRATTNFAAVAPTVVGSN